MNQSKSKASITDNDLIEFLKNLPASEKYWIAYSGGMDSSVLLHLFYSISDKLNKPVEVIYVDHGLNPKSQKWGKFCINQSQEYGFSFKELVIDEEYKKGESIEAWAREKRYELVNEAISDKDIVFTGHHQDDQVETFFLQALRGSGPRGLSSMPNLKKMNKGLLARPLLNYSRDALLQYAKNNNLNWCEDESNQKQQFDRNYLRQSVLPIVEARWPTYRDTINRLLNHQQEYTSLLDEVAGKDLKNSIGTENNCLVLSKVNDLSFIRQKNLIYFWLNKLNLDLPAAKHMNNIIHEIINIDTDKSPCINWTNVELRRYRDLLYAGKKMSNIDIESVIMWDISKPVSFLEETLSAQIVTGNGLSEHKTKNSKLEIRHRQGGEKINPVNLNHSKTIKQLFQENGVLPWFRDRIPLIYIDENLAAIPGFCIDKNYAAQEDEAGWEIKWTGYEKVVQR